MSHALHRLSVSELAKRIRSGELSPVELTRSALERIEAFDGKLGAFRLVCAERALDAARAGEAALREGHDRGPLQGIPFVAKDLFDVAGLPTTAGTRLLADNIATCDSTAVSRLVGRGMVLLGKTNTVQFAYGGAGVNHDHGTPHNPWHREPHLPGGSSSGTAVAIAAGLTPAGLGTDTGGSVRIPAAFCGISGLKTTVGRVSRAGVYPLSATLDSVGPLARTAEDVALLYDAMRGADGRDDTTRGRPSQGLHSLTAGARGLRLAFAESVFWDEADREVVAAVRECGKVFADLGAHVSTIEFPEAREATELNPQGLVIAAEAYAVNRRFIDEHYDELDPIVASRIVAGRDVPAHELLRTESARQALVARTDAALRDIDALLCPTVMIPAPPLADAEASPEAYRAINLCCLRNTSIGNLLGLCGLSVPCGFTRAGLPIGLMIYGRAFREDVVLRVGHAFQQATDWHLRVPELDWIPA